MKRDLNLIFAIAAGAFLILAGQRSFWSSVHAFPPPSIIREVRQSAVEDALALSLGLRRLAADLWYIRLLQYYGATEPESADNGSQPSLSHTHVTSGHDHEAHDNLDHFGEGKYPEFLSLARHILALDPSFTNAGLYAAGSLAFNLSRPEEAIGFLNWALLYNPKEWKYLILITAIGYSKAKDPAKVAEIIAPLLNEPDCPVMLRQLAAFLNKKSGNYKAAYGIYRTILETSKDKFYLDNASREMAKLELILK